MDRESGVLNFNRVARVVYGPGSTEHITTVALERGLERAFVATTKSLASSKGLENITALLGDRYVGTFSGCTQHVGEEGARKLTAELERTDADLLIVYGGGSVIDTCKVAVGAILTGKDLMLEAKQIDFAVNEPEAVGRLITQVALPTTLSAGEYNGVTAFTNNQGEKLAIYDHRLGPPVIINDPVLALETPDSLWVSTGVRALDHAVEGMYSAHSSSFIDALATQAIRLLSENLPASLSSDPEDRLHARGHCLTGALLSNYATINTNYGLSHAIGHKVGAKWMVPHGMNSCIALPHATRFVANLAPERCEGLADAFGISQEASDRGLRAADAIEALIGQLNVPISYSHFGLTTEDLEEVVSDIHYEVEHGGTIPEPVTDEQIREILRCCV